MGVRVVTDSACDLPDDLIERNGIEVVPLTIRFGNEELIDRKELSTDEFWRRLADSDVLPETSAPSAGAFEGAFRRQVEDGATGIICINLSSKLSATMQSAQVAAQAVQADCPVVVIDSLMVSMGLGSLCLTAAQRAADGDSLESIVANVTDRRNRSKLYGALDTLEFLKKGGRVGNTRVTTRRSSPAASATPGRFSARCWPSSPSSRYATAWWRKRARSAPVRRRCASWSTA